MDDDEKGKVTTVKGHLCEGLTKFFEAATYGCIPRIGGDGVIHGCDDSNPIAIQFCPFCGVSLEVPAS